MEEFNVLEQKVKEIAIEINRAEQNRDMGKAINLKKELYNTKLTMLEMIQVDDKRAGISARELIARANALPTLPRYGTGINALDSMLKGGFQTGMFVQLAGESGVGKTHLFLEILSNIAKGNKTVFFNFEMGIRLISARLAKLLKTDVQLDNLIVDSDTRNLKDLIMEIELYAKEGIKFFAIDSKMKIEIDGNADEHLKISKMSSELAKLAQKRDIVILLINQMNEMDIKNKRLAMKGSGDQKYDADIALFYVKDEKTRNRTLICNKNRQDEIEFAVELRLNAYGKTVGVNDPIETVFEAEQELNINDFDMGLV